MYQEILQKTFFQNTVQNYLTFLVIFSLGVIGIKILKGVVLARLRKWSEKTTTTTDDFIINLLEKKLIPLLYLAILYFSLQSLTLTKAVTQMVKFATAGIITFYGIRLLISLINYSLEQYWIKKEGRTFSRQSLKGIITLIKVVIWGIGITFLLDNLGFKISTVIAGLGIGGIAVALAAQTILGDLFNYFVIFFDRPFEVDDFIIIGDYMGTIETIGIKTTRIRSLGGEQLVFSNTDLTNSRIRNYKRMQKRRVLFRIGIVYQTKLEQMKEIPGLIKEIVESIPDTVFDRAHFASFGDFSLDIEIVYYILSSDYNKYMDIQQELNFKIMEEFEKRGIEFAYPTRTIFLEKSDKESAIQ